MSPDDPQQTRPDREQSGPAPVSRAGLGWDPPAHDGAAHEPGTSLRTRAAAEQARARSTSLRPALTRTGAVAAAGVVVAILATVMVGAVAGGVVAAVCLAAAAATLAWSTRPRWGGDAMSRELRRAARHERQVAATLDGLETAGWVVLHDRLVDAHRVPHLLVGPPGVALLYPASFGRLARTRAVGRRARALVRSVVHAVLVLPATILTRRPLPHLSTHVPAVVVDVDVDRRAADWATRTLLGRLAADPRLDGWTVCGFTELALLHHPHDRALPAPDHYQVGYHDAGPALRRHLEAEPGSLPRPAVAYLASIIEETCPPA